MCVGQPGGLAEGRAPTDCLDGAVADCLAARLLEVLVKGLSGFPEGPERAEECSKRRRLLASKLSELQGAIQEIVAIDQGKQQSLVPLLQRAHGCCAGLRQAAAVLKVQESAQLKDAEAADATEAWARLEVALSVCQGQVRRLAAPRQPQEARGGCMAGLRRLWAKPELRAAIAPPKAEAERKEAPPSPSERAEAAEDSWQAFAGSLARQDGRAPRVLCSDSYVAEALLVGKCGGATPAVTCIVEDPTQARRLSCAVGAAATGAVLFGTPRASVQRLTEQGEAFDVAVLEEPVLAQLPAELLAPGGRAVPRGSLPTDLSKLIGA